MTEREIFNRMPPGEKIAYAACHAVPALFFLVVVIITVSRAAHITWW